MMEVLTEWERCSDTVSWCYPLSSTDVLWKTCNTNHSQYLVQAWMHLTYLRVSVPTFSPPCDCEEAAPGCVGAGDDTELWMTSTAGCTPAAGSSLGDLPLSASAAPADPASVEELLIYFVCNGNAHFSIGSNLNLTCSSSRYSGILWTGWRSRSWREGVDSSPSMSHWWNQRGTVQTEARQGHNQII